MVDENKGMLPNANANFDRVCTWDVLIVVFHAYSYTPHQTFQTLTTNDDALATIVGAPAVAAGGWSALAADRGG